MISLKATRLHWIQDNGADDPNDLCAHSPVAFSIGNQSIVCPEDGDWTVSASAIFLLRALRRDHTKLSPVGDQVFPCCGHGIFDVGEPEVVICGCSHGIDLEIRQTSDGYAIATPGGECFTIPGADWRSAVLRFSAQVLDFYEVSAPKASRDEEARKGFTSMMAEWKRIHAEQEAEGVGERRSAP